jgi:hypothetical protein
MSESKAEYRTSADKRSKLEMSDNGHSHVWYDETCLCRTTKLAAFLRGVRRNTLPAFNSIERKQRKIVDVALLESFFSQDLDVANHSISFARENLDNSTHNPLHRRKISVAQQDNVVDLKMVNLTSSFWSLLQLVEVFVAPLAPELLLDFLKLFPFRQQRRANLDEVTSWDCDKRTADKKVTRREDPEVVGIVTDGSQGSGVQDCFDLAEHSHELLKRQEM